jgi:hypothetical protein
MLIKYIHILLELIFCPLPPLTLSLPTGRAGMPTTVVWEGTALVTTELAPTAHLLPTTIGPNTFAPAPTQHKRGKGSGVSAKGGVKRER